MRAKRPQRVASMCDGVERAEADLPDNGSQLATGTSRLEWSAEKCRAAADELELCGRPCFFDIAAVSTGRRVKR